MYMHELKEKLCEELKEIARKGELGAGDLEIVDCNPYRNPL